MPELRYVTSIATHLGDVVIISPSDYHGAETILPVSYSGKGFPVRDSPD
jgi:hypothetical protein